MTRPTRTSLAARTDLAERAARTRAQATATTSALDLARHLVTDRPDLAHRHPDGLDGLARDLDADGALDPVRPWWGLGYTDRNRAYRDGHAPADVVAAAQIAAHVLTECGVTAPPSEPGPARSVFDTLPGVDWHGPEGARVWADLVAIGLDPDTPPAEDPAERKAAADRLAARMDRRP